MDTSVVPAAVTDALARARSVEAVGLVVRGAARALVGADGATFVLAEGDACFYEDEDAIAPLWKGQRFPMRECLSGWAMLRGEVVRIRDVELDDRVPLEAYLPTFVRSLLIVPVGSPARAAIGAYWARHHAASDDEATRLCELAAQAAAALERTGMEGAPWAPDLSRPATIDASRLTVSGPPAQGVPPGSPPVAAAAGTPAPGPARPAP